MSCSCNEFSRAAVLRRSVAEAGRGLPVIEAGMPLPAGSGLSRRTFLTRTAGLALSVYGASKLPLGLFEEGIGRAAGPTDPVLVSIFLDGGADSLSMLYPAGDAQYAGLRPHLALAPEAGEPFAEDASLHWHPSLAPLAELHGEGKVDVLPAVGYTNTRPGRTSRPVTTRKSGATDAHLRTGWLGRYLDLAGTWDNPLQGLALSDSLHPALASASVPIAAVSRVDDYGFWAEGESGEPETRMLDAIGSFAPSSDPGRAHVAEVAAQVASLRGRLLPSTMGTGAAR